ncbi:MAG: PepSY domain-containing protein [Chloroflexaceae bacterium]|nr:PepSY domain-containing protein [Chloroflexaceae bacterium]
MSRKGAKTSLIVGGLALVGVLALAVTLVVVSVRQDRPPPSVLPTIAALHQELEITRQQHRRDEEANHRLQQTIQALRRVTDGASSHLPPNHSAGSHEAGQIDRDQAIAIATSYLRGGTVVEVEMEDEHGALVYEVTFQNGSKVYVEVATGRVVYAYIRDASGDDEEDED